MESFFSRREKNSPPLLLLLPPSLSSTKGLKGRSMEPVSRRGEPRSTLSSSRYCYKRKRGQSPPFGGRNCEGDFHRRGGEVKRTGAGRHARGWWCCTMVTRMVTGPGLDHRMTSLPRYQDTKDQRPMKTSPSPQLTL